MMRTMGAKVRGIAAAALTVCILVGVSGCSLLTPSRANVAPDEVRTKLTTPAIATKGVLTVGISSANAPQVMTDSTGQLTGYAVDVARALGKNLGLSVTFVTDGSASKVGGSGEPDIYLGATDADASDTVTVSGDYLEDAPALFTKVADGSSASATISAESLAGATIAVQTGSSAAKALSESGISATTKSYANVNDCLKALEDGEVQYVACSATTGAYISRAYTDIAMAGTIGAATTYGVAMRSTSIELSDAVNKALNEISSNGVLDAIHLAWYGTLPMSLSDATVSGVSAAAASGQASQQQDQSATSDSTSSTAAASTTTDAASSSDSAT